MAAPPPYAEEVSAFKFGEEEETIDLGIPPVSPTATVPVLSTTLSTPGFVSGNLSSQAPSPRSPIPTFGGPSGVATSNVVSGNMQPGGNAPRGFGGGGNAALYPQRAVGTDTLDEPVSTTILRDLKNVWLKLKQVLVPHGQKDILKDWDLWGPLLLCLTLAIFLSINTSGDQALVFTGIFVIVWVGSAVVTLNSKLLGGKVSFFQSVCVLGYCICPLTVASIIGSFLKQHFVVRTIITAVAFVWSTYASIGFLSERSLDNRRTLAVYPIFLFYFAISWIVLIA